MSININDTSTCVQCGCTFGDWRTVFAGVDLCPVCNAEELHRAAQQINAGADAYCRRTFGCGNFDPTDGGGSDYQC